MDKNTTSDRLKQIMSEKNLKQIDIINMAKPYCEKYKIKLGRNDLSQYIAGKVIPRQNKLYVLGKVLNVSEAWLMGFDVPRERIEPKEEALTSSYDNLPDSASPPKVDPDSFAFQMYKKLDSDDKAEIRGEMKHMLKSDKYKDVIETQPSIQGKAAAWEGENKVVSITSNEQATIDKIMIDMEENENK